MSTTDLRERDWALLGDGIRCGETGTGDTMAAVCYCCAGRLPSRPGLPWRFVVFKITPLFNIIPDSYCLVGQLVLPGHHLTVGPILRVVNLLPCDLSYFLDGTNIRGRLPANKAASIFEVGRCRLFLVLFTARMKRKRQS